MADTVRTRGKQRSLDDSEGTIAEDIYTATLRLMETTPYPEISVAQILTGANISRTTLYAYVSSKPAVLRRLLERAMDDIFAPVTPFLRNEGRDRPSPEAESPEPVGRALERSIRSVAHSWHTHRTVLRSVALQWPTDPDLREVWLAIAERFIDAGAREIEREQAAGVIASPLPGRTLATTLFWGTERVLHIAGLGVDPALPDEESAVDALITMWRGTLYGDSGPVREKR